MTYDEIKASDKEFLTAEDIAPIVGSQPMAIRYAARERPELLGFPVMVIKSRVRIPRRSFLRFWGGQDSPTP